MPFSAFLQDYVKLQTEEVDKAENLLAEVWPCELIALDSCCSCLED